MAQPEDTDNTTSASNGAAGEPAKTPPLEHDRQTPEPASSETGADAVRGQPSALSAALTAQRMQIQDLERAMVDRIADVDDDRRRGEAILHRASEAQRAALESRLRHRAWLTILGFILLLAPVAVLLLFQHRQIQALEHRIEAQTPPRQDIPVHPITQVGEDDTDARLDTLERKIAQVSAAVERLAKTPRAAPADLSAETIAIGKRVDALSRDLAQVSAALDRLDAEDSRARPAAEPPAQITALDERIDALSKSVAQLAAGLQRLEARARNRDRSAAGPSAEAVTLTHQIEQLEDKQRRLLDELQTLRALPTAPPRDPEVAVRQTAPAQGEQAIGAPVRAAAAAPSGRKPDSDTAGGPADAPPLETVSDRPWALQLIGFHDREDLLAFAAKAQLPPRAFVRTEQLRGRPWFALIHSLHPSYEAASEAAKALPPALSALEPWIHTLPPGSELEIIRTDAAR